MNKIITSISIDVDLFTYFKDKKINLSEWVNEKMKKDMNNRKQKIELLDKEIEERQRQKDSLKKEIKEEKYKQKDILKNLTKEQIDEIEDSIKILKERGDSFFEGRYSRYKNMFDATISKETFKILLEAYSLKDN